VADLIVLPDKKAKFHPDATGETKEELRLQRQFIKPSDMNGAKTK